MHFPFLESFKHTKYLIFFCSFSLSVTERYVEEESTDASDNEVSEAASPVSTTNAPPDDAKKEIKLNTVTKKSTKQSNLMSFFKK